MHGIYIRLHKERQAHQAEIQGLQVWPHVWPRFMIPPEIYMSHAARSRANQGNCHL